MNYKGEIILSMLVISLLVSILVVNIYDISKNVNKLYLNKENYSTKYNISKSIGISDNKPKSILTIKNGR